jgi:hypothetical protein
MTDYEEEQEMEVEALEAIYMEDFKKTSDTPLAYEVQLLPNPPGEENHVAISIHCVIPPEYPDTVPQVWIVEDAPSQFINLTLEFNLHIDQSCFGEGSIGATRRRIAGIGRPTGTSLCVLWSPCTCFPSNTCCTTFFTRQKKTQEWQ